jgi:hypothetical protein
MATTLLSSKEEWDSKIKKILTNPSLRVEKGKLKAITKLNLISKI